ncbi:alpha/beta fold hydrolase [Sorangium sp. So ce131]|uniref:alpha/beta fold hydrolase n=1 Tax=Sorangium sp. So ce131 TaxID=3133282 RepID=UPI003F60C7EC
MDHFDHQSGHFLEIDGASLYYEVVGQETGPALVLLHGGFGDMEDFNVLVPDLARRFRVIGVDSRGHGKSTLGGAPLTYERLQGDVERLVGQLGLDRYDILGFSDGGIVAYRMAARDSSAIRRLVTVGAHWELREDDPVREILSKVTAESWRAKFPSTYDSYQRLNPEPDFDAFAGAVVRMWLDAGPSGYPGDAVEKISCRSLIARGEDDHLASRDQISESARRIRGATALTIPGAGHAAFQDQPALFLRSLSEFLE